MSSPGQLRQCLRLLLLPLPAAREGACAKALLTAIRLLEIPSQDLVDWLSLQLGVWKDTGVVPQQLGRTVNAVLVAAVSNDPSLLPEKYFSIHRRLMSDHLLTHQDARVFLSNALLMIDLAQRERLSSAQIAKLIERRDRRVLFSRQAISLLLEHVALKREISKSDVSRLYLKDSNLELATFADADLVTAAELVHESAVQLGFQSDLSEALMVLASENKLAAYTPYLQVLHYQCTIAEFYDHAVTDLYEFSPRGLAANWLFDAYPKNLVSAGNPFLNNMKSVGSIDATWVRSKKQAELPGAHALLDILLGLEALGFAARREVARLIRLWIHRVMRLSEPLIAVLPTTLSSLQVKQVLKQVASANTSTYGVIEQRVVDAIVANSHLLSDGWRVRGLGDSVHATNISKRKLGDCDAQHPTMYLIEAYEAHGGALTDIYVDEHLRTLKKVIGLRVNELIGIADAASWKASITFIAHQIVVRDRDPVEIDGIEISMTFTTFKSFINSAAGKGGSKPDWKKWVLDPLNERRTPIEARNVLLDFIEIKK